ncbi:MAG: HAD family hydrolase [Actinomycetota bacterium]|nr:HAD family hydrolase [Actinomycetota bacterium]
MPTSGRRFDAIFLDVGGVLVMPHLDTITGHFADAGFELDRDRLLEAHYRGVLAIDQTKAGPEEFGDYHREFATAAGVVEADLARGIAVLEAIWETADLWREPLPWAADGLAALAELDLPLVIVSNADGTIERVLADAGICQVGPGPGIELAGVIDSGVVGVAKPDPAIFRLALDVAGVAAARAVHIGDTYQYDVLGARAAGVHPVLMDPLGLRPDADCERIASLTEAVALIG